MVLGKEINCCGVAKENWNFWYARKESIKTQVPNLVVKRQKIEVPKTGTWHLHPIIGRRRRLPRLVRKFFAFSPELVLLLRFLVSLSLHSFAISSYFVHLPLMLQIQHLVDGEYRKVPEKTWFHSVYIWLRFGRKGRSRFSGVQDLVPVCVSLFT